MTHEVLECFSYSEVNNLFLAKDPFDDFVQRRTELSKRTSEPFDPQKTLDIWRDDITRLYHDIETYLQTYIESKQIKVNRRTIPITEDALGTYTVEALTLKIGDEEIDVRPFATMLFGAFGRVDLSGRRKKVRILFVRGRRSAIRFFNIN